MELLIHSQTQTAALLKFGKISNLIPHFTELLSIGLLEIDLSEILIKIQTISLSKMSLKLMSENGDRFILPLMC